MILGFEGKADSLFIFAESYSLVGIKKFTGFSLFGPSRRFGII